MLHRQFGGLPDHDASHDRYVRGAGLQTRLVGTARTQTAWSEDPPHLPLLFPAACKELPGSQRDLPVLRAD